MKKRFVLLTMLLISGCSTVERYSNKENPKNVLHTNWNENIAKDYISGEYSKVYDELNCFTETTKANAERNKQLERFLIGVDSYYYKNKNALITGRAATDTVSDIVQLGLTGAASFAGGSTPNVLAAIATALNGSKLSFDKNMFADQSSLLMVAKMDQIRLTKLNHINKNKVKDCGKYSLNAAMKDAIEYYYMGTVNGALLAIFTETGGKMIAAKAEENKIINTDYKTTIDKQNAEIKEKELTNKERELHLLNTIK